MSELKELILAVKELTVAFEKYNKPVVIVTNNPNCELVVTYQQKGHPVYFPDWNDKKEQ